MNQKVSIIYKNYRGETAWRVIAPEILYFGNYPPYHPEQQWLLDAVDEAKRDADFCHERHSGVGSVY